MTSRAFDKFTELLNGTRPEWQKDGACNAADPDMFFPTRGDFLTSEKAKAVCARCTVTNECLEYAFAQGVETTGIWGGTSQMDRRKLSAKLNRKAS